MINCYYYDENKIKELKNLNDIENVINNNALISYIKVSDPSEQELQDLSSIFNLHTISIENINSTKHLTKIEEYDNYISTMMYQVINLSNSDEIEMLPFTIIMNSNFMLIISKENQPFFDEILSKITSNAKNLFISTTKLYYIILDLLVDNIFPILSTFEDRLDNLEEGLLNSVDYDATKEILALRQGILKLKRVFTWEQEALYRLTHEEIKFIRTDQLIYLKDVFHHIEKLNLTLEDYNNWASNLSDAYSSNSSSKLNDRMNSLTMVQYVFMPLTFLCGWYGMSFNTMPEYNLKYGYIYFILFTITVTTGMFMYFKKKKML